MTHYCVFCGFATDTDFITCADCATLLGICESFVPTTCGDDLCYCLPNGEVNFDGDCEHGSQFIDIVYRVR